MINQVQQWIIDSDDDGIPDDIAVRFIVAPSTGEDTARFRSLILRLATFLGQQVGALPLPLFVTEPGNLPEHIQMVRLESASQIESLLPATGPEEIEITTEPSPCPGRMFTLDDMLADRDGDLLPDTIRVRFDLSDDIQPELVAAVANLAARTGLESAPDSAISADGPVFQVHPGDRSASIAATDNGWIATGAPDDLATLLNRVSADWPHISLPETGGVGYSLGVLRRWLAGDGPESRTPGQLVWEREWSDDWEVDRVRAAFSDQVLPSLDATRPLDLTVFLSEPQDIRQQFAAELGEILTTYGFTNVDITTVCTFKAGLSWLRETVIPRLQGTDVAAIDIQYRRFETDETALDRPTRWLQECFPGDEILARDLGLPLEAITFTETHDGPTFRAVATDAAGNPIDSVDLSLLATTWPFVEAVPGSGTMQVTTSGVIARQGDTRLDVPVASDLERFWTFWQGEVIPQLLAHIENQGGAIRHLQPFFERLEVEVSVSEPNQRLRIREENDSAAEALHEDIYFNALDAIELYGKQQSGETCNAPGAVVPVVRLTPGKAPSATVRLYRAVKPDSLPYPDLRICRLALEDDTFLPEITVVDPAPETVARLQELAGKAEPDGPGILALVTAGDETVRLRLPLQPVLTSSDPPAEAPTMHANIQGEAVTELAASLAAFPPVTAWIEDWSYEGRPIPVLSLVPPTPGRLRSPRKMSLLKPTSLIVARHHANEISSTNAAFRLAWLTATDPEWISLLKQVNIVIIPYENPDGAALHARLTSDPAAMYWKHHPARYNALGYEFSQDMGNPDTRFGESRVRPSIWQRFLPDAVVDNHGVPSHEWVQPFAGFGSPPRFPVSYWIPQALLYGIVGYVESEDFPEHREMAFALRDAVSDIVADTDIGDLNRQIGRSYRFWGQQRDPERFPGEFHNDMLWHMAGRPPDPEGRGFSARFPKTTVLNWVTEVIDETATGDHLEITARAHLLANQAMLRLLATGHGRRRIKGETPGP